jgi:SAM-dependent methyltransferase
MTTSPRYGLHADRYRRYRPGYPDAPFDRAVEACGPPLSRAVELGAGSGQATPQVLKRFERVTAVEPDPEMAALIPSDPRLEVKIGKAEEVDLGAPVDAVFSATAFHWMDAAVVCRRVAQALRPKGVFLAIGYGPFVVRGPDAAAAVLAEEARLWLPHMDRRLSAWRPYAELIAETGVFPQLEPIDFEFEKVVAPEDAAGLWLTTSFASAYARETGDEQAYLQGFMRRMAEATSGEKVTVGFTVTGALART